ncbi:MAG TPA: hypothetical protein VMM15_41660 [Bradyrhizobium sp.]|nr:hypothetical protein [Bradyrhizobium sp.]
MAGKTVLAIGIDPAFADLSGQPQLSAELVRSHIDAELQRLRDQGFAVVPCLTDLGETAEQAVTAALNSENFDCVVIGAGLRVRPERLLLFEKILNHVHRLAPRASICFNTNPADTAEAVRRWLAP